jgi:hypothetical protein
MEATMRIRYIGKWSGSPDGDSPTIWMDEDTRDYYLQGYTVTDAEVRTRLLGKAGKDSVPSGEEIVRWPADMVALLMKEHGEESGADTR